MRCVSKLRGVTTENQLSERSQRGSEMIVLEQEIINKVHEVCGCKLVELNL